MRTYLFLCLVLSCTLGSCLRDECSTKQTYVRFDPIYKTLAEMRVGIKAGAPRSMKKPGKIYVLGHYLFINEQQEGIHVVDNSNPESPRNVAFWSIPGNVDMAIRGNYLYADQYVDLLTIDIQDFQNPTLVCRRELAFSLFGVDPVRGFLVGYQPTEITETLDCSDPRLASGWFRQEGNVFLSIDNIADASVRAAVNGAGLFTSTGKAVAASAGIAGSYARFAVVNDILYTVDNSILRTWDIGQHCPSPLNSRTLGWNIETIFPWKDRLFIGSQTGVFIFNNRDPRQPVQEATFSHANGCDPVVCDDTRAYVTIHSANTCRGVFNQLDVLNIEKLPTVSLIRSYPMKQPKGLSIAGKYLYLCDDGLKIFDRTKDTDLKQLSHVKNLDTYDAIALDETHLLVVGNDGFLQFDVSDPENPRRISTLWVEK